MENNGNNRSTRKPDVRHRAFGLVVLFFRAVVEIQAKVSGDHDKVQYIEEHYIPNEVAADDFAEDTADITKVNEQQEREALAFGGLVAVGGDDVVRPGKAECDDHCDFQNLCHKIFILLPHIQRL